MITSNCGDAKYSGSEAGSEAGRCYSVTLCHRVEVQVHLPKDCTKHMLYSEPDVQKDEGECVCITTMIRGV